MWKLATFSHWKVLFVYKQMSTIYPHFRKQCICIQSIIILRFLNTCGTSDKIIVNKLAIRVVERSTTEQTSLGGIVILQYADKAVEFPTSHKALFWNVTSFVITQNYPVKHSKTCTF